MTKTIPSIGQQIFDNALSLLLVVSQGSVLTISGFAYPNETLTAPTGSSYQWYVDNIARGTAQTLTLTVNDIGLPVRCVVGAAECTPVTVWHPRDIANVKNFWWAAQGAYNTLANNVTDANASIIVTLFISESLVRAVGNDQNGKAAYGSNFGVLDTASKWCYWDGVQWILNIVAVAGESSSDYTYYSSDDTTYPWEVTTWIDGGLPPTVTRQVTTYDALATDGQAVTVWRDIISGLDVTSGGSGNTALFEATDLSSASLKFDSTDYFNIPTALRTVFNNQSYGYIFAGVKDTAPTGGDTTHGVISINRQLGSVKLALTTNRANNTRFNAITNPNNLGVTEVESPNNNTGDYTVLTNEAMWADGEMRLRIDGNQVAAASFTANVTNSQSGPSYIGAYTSNGTTNFNGYMTAIVLAADIDSNTIGAMSDTDRNRIERFIGLLDGLNIASGGIGAVRIGSDNPANAAEPDATAWVLMDGPWYNTAGDPNSGFVGGQSWRKMEPIGYAPYGNETYVYGDETVRYETGVWLYLNTTLGEIARAYGYETYPWLATWNNGFTGAKITSSYVKTTNYPAVP
jgi:hypothetical protein